jgi:hypothetical protein
MDFPVIALINVCESRRDASFRHYGMGFPKQALGNHAHANATS